MERLRRSAMAGQRYHVCPVASTPHQARRDAVRVVWRLAPEAYRACVDPLEIGIRVDLGRDFANACFMARSVEGALFASGRSETVTRQSRPLALSQLPLPEASAPTAATGGDCGRPTSPDVDSGSRRTLSPLAGLAFARIAGVRFRIAHWRTSRPCTGASPIVASMPAVNARWSDSMPSEKITPCSGIRERICSGWSASMRP